MSFCAPVAQRIEQRFPKPQVEGSTPFGRTKSFTNNLLLIKSPYIDSFSAYLYSRLPLVPSQSFSFHIKGIIKRRNNLRRAILKVTITMNTWKSNPNARSGNLLSSSIFFTSIWIKEKLEGSRNIWSSVGFLNLGSSPI